MKETFLFEKQLPPLERNSLQLVNFHCQDAFFLIQPLYKANSSFGAM